MTGFIGATPNKKYCEYLVVIEPQCVDEEHVSVNQSIISLFNQSLKPKKIELYADQHHYCSVMENSTWGIANKSNIIKLPLGKNFRANKIKRVLYEFVLVYIALRMHMHNIGRESTFLFTSATRFSLLFAKIIQLTTKSRIFIVGHGILQQLELNQSFFFNFKVFNLKWQLCNFLNKRILFFVNSNYIRKNILEIAKVQGEYLVSLDFSFISTGITNEKPAIEKWHSHIRFANLGIGSKSKGTDIYFNIANIVKKDNRKEINFIYGGKIIDENFPLNNSVDIYGVDKMLTKGDYFNLLTNSDVLILPYPKNSYRFGLSGVFMDAIMSNVPVICLKSQMSNYIYDEFGDFGWQFDSTQEIIDLIYVLTKEDVECKRKQVESNTIKFNDKNSLINRSIKLTSILSELHCK